MRKRYALDSRWVANVLLFAGLPLLILVLVVGFPWLRKAPASLTIPPQSTPVATITVLPVVQKPQVTPALATATIVPVVVVVSDTAALPLGLSALPTAALLPDPGPGDIAVVTPEATVPIATVPTLQPSPPVVDKPAPTKTRDPNLLPNGVRYGDHKPNLPDRIVRISSPNIKLDTSVYEVYINRKQNVWEVADYAAGHNFNSPNPGEGGNIILSGHNNWRGEVFRYLEFLKPGDTIQVWTLEGKEYDYKVTDIRKLKEAGVSMAQRLKNAEVMNPTDHEQLTLITCWPYTTYTHRLIVTALPVK
jgi:sortase A